MLTIDKALNAIWRVQQAAADRPARARLLVGGDARSAAAGGEPDRHLVRGLGVARLRSARCRAASASLHRRARVRADRDRRRGAVPLRAQHPRALAPCAGRRPVRRRRHRRRQARCSRSTSAPCRPTHGLRRLRDGADLPDLDLPELGDRAARRGDRRLRAGGGHAPEALAGHDRARASGSRWRCCASCAAARDGGHAGADRPDALAMRSRSIRCRSIRCSTPWSRSTGSAASTRRATRRYVLLVRSGRRRRPSR